MPAKSEIQIMTEAIINQYGQAFFNIDEASKIIGCGRNTLARILSESGILIRRIGPSKRISAYDLVALMYRDRVTSYNEGA